MLEAAAELKSGDATRMASTWLQLGRPELVVAQGDGVPRSLRAQALLMIGDPKAVIALLGVVPDLAGSELYVLASALGSVGRGRDALELLERSPPSGATERALHDQIVRRLRETLIATQQTDPSRLHR